MNIVSARSRFYSLLMPTATIYYQLILGQYSLFFRLWNHYKIFIKIELSQKTRSKLKYWKPKESSQWVNWKTKVNHSNVWYVIESFDLTWLRRSSKFWGYHFGCSTIKNSNGYLVIYLKATVKKRVNPSVSLEHCREYFFQLFETEILHADWSCLNIFSAGETLLALFVIRTKQQRSEKPGR